MINKYTHLELDKEQKVMAGYYIPLKEVRLKHNNREVLYTVGQAVIESSCCGSGSYGYVLVPGYIINWQNGNNKDGLSVSEVESIPDKVSQGNIIKIIEEAEHISQIEFW